MSFNLFRSAAANEVVGGAGKAAPGIGVAVAPLFNVYLPAAVQIATVVYMAVLTVLAVAKYYRDK